MLPLIHSYKPLASTSDAKGDEPVHPDKSHYHKRWHWLLVFALVTSFAGNLALSVLWASYGKHGCSVYYPELTDSPAKGVLRYKILDFNRDLIDEIYEQDPSSTVDAAWRELYEFSGSTLPGQDRIPSFNETLEFVRKKGNGIRMLDVFHQLHCLDTVRQALYPHHYNHPIDPGHVIHCINSVRQSIMCMADISVVSWEWSQELDTLIESEGNIHTCRNFDGIKEWALENHFDRQFVG